MAATQSSPLTTEQVSQREWPLLRAAIVDIAAALDRLDRAGAGAVRDEAERLLTGLLAAETTERAELVLTELSRGYDPTWRERFAAGETRPDPPAERA